MLVVLQKFSFLHPVRTGSEIVGKGTNHKKECCIAMEFLINVAKNPSNSSNDLHVTGEGNLSGIVILFNV